MYLKFIKFYVIITVTMIDLAVEEETGSVMEEANYDVHLRAPSCYVHI